MYDSVFKNWGIMFSYSSKGCDWCSPLGVYVAGGSGGGATLGTGPKKSVPQWELWGPLDPDVLGRRKQPLSHVCTLDSPATKIYLKWLSDRCLRTQSLLFYILYFIFFFKRILLFVYFLFYYILFPSKQTKVLNKNPLGWWFWSSSVGWGVTSCLEEQ